MPGAYLWALGGLDEGLIEVVMDGPFLDSERPADTNRRQVAAVDQAVDGHLADAHDVGHFGDREEPHLRQGAFSLSHQCTGLSLNARPGLRAPVPSPWTATRTTIVRLRRPAWVNGEIRLIAHAALLRARVRARSTGRARGGKKRPAEWP